MSITGDIFASAGFATVYPRIGGRRTRLMKHIKRVAIEMFQVVGIFILSHVFPPLVMNDKHLGAIQRGLVHAPHSAVGEPLASY